MTALDLDDFISDWLAHRAGDRFNPPALTNFLGNVQAATDPVAVQHLTFPPFSHGSAPLGTLLIDGCCPGRSAAVIRYRWRPDRIQRATEVDGLALESRTVMEVGAQAVTTALTVRNLAATTRRVRLGLRAAGGVIHAPDGWRTPYAPQERPEISVTPWEGAPPPASLAVNRMERGTDGNALLFASETSQAFALHATAPPADAIERTTFRFELTLAPGETRRIDYRVAVSADRCALQRATAAWREDPEAPHHRAETFWTEEVNAVFTPGNERYSGWLPRLETTNTDLRRIYLTAVMGAVYMKRRHPESAYGRTYVTLMPRYWVTTSFMNDWSLSAWMLAALDPDCVKKHVEIWLARDIHSHFGTEYASGASQGNWYSCNDHAICRLVSAVLKTTGDTAWLTREVAGRTLLAHLREIALGFEVRRSADAALADCGDRNSLLEAVGSYEGEVAALNAAWIWTLRETAEILAHAGESADAEDLRRRADALVPQVQELYVVGGGHWRCRRPDGTTPAVRTAWDFVHTVNLIGGELRAPQLAEMVEFFERELMTPSWMRALSAVDEDADFSLRPDHQWNGSYPAWTAFAARALVAAGRTDLLAGWLPGLARSANQGPWAQAHFTEDYVAPEAGGARKAPAEWPYITDWANLAVGGFWELVVFDLFGVTPGLDALRVHPGLEAFDPAARLVDLRHHDRRHTLSAAGSDYFGLE